MTSARQPEDKQQLGQREFTRAYAVDYIVDRYLLDEFILSIIAFNPDARRLNEKITKLGIDKSARSLIDNTIQRWTKEEMLYLIHGRVKGHSYTPYYLYEDSFNPIMFAAKYAHDEGVIATLLKAGAKPHDEVDHCFNKIFRWNVAMIAAYFGNVPFFKAAYRHLNDSGNTEAKKAFAESINKRVPAGNKDPELEKFGNWTVLGIAIQWGSPKLVEYVLLNGAKLDAKLEKGKEKGKLIHELALNKLRKSSDSEARDGLSFIDLIIKKTLSSQGASASSGSSASFLPAPSSSSVSALSTVKIEEADADAIEALVQGPLRQPDVFANPARALLAVSASSRADRDEEMSPVSESAASALEAMSSAVGGAAHLTEPKAKPRKKRETKPRKKRARKLIDVSGDGDHPDDDYIHNASRPVSKKQKLDSEEPKQHALKSRQQYQNSLPLNFPTYTTKTELDKIQLGLGGRKVRSMDALLSMLNEQLEVKITKADIEKQKGLNQIQTAVLYSICCYFKKSNLFKGLIDRAKYEKQQARTRAGMKRDGSYTYTQEFRLFSLPDPAAAHQPSASPSEHSHSHSASSVARDPSQGGGMNAMGCLVDTNAVNRASAQSQQQDYVPRSVPLSTYTRSANAPLSARDPRVGEHDDEKSKPAPR